MTPDEIVALWREHKEVHAFARAVEAIARADEREVCAKRLEAVGCDHCAANIRLRGQDPMPLFDDWGMK
jgi:hypothetical protein